jgi:hypothetical protein
MSLPCKRLYAFVHLTLRGFLFILKFLWHFDRQKRKICQGDKKIQSLLQGTNQIIFKERKTYALPYFALSILVPSITISPINT